MEQGWTARGWNRRGWVVITGCLALSTLVHGVSYAGLSALPTRAALDQGLGELEVEVLELPPLAPDPEEPPVEEDPEEEAPAPKPIPVVPKPRDVPVAKPNPKPDPDPDPAPAEETLAEFDGLVMTNEGTSGSGWSTQQASGRDWISPIGAPGVATGRRREGDPNGAVGGTGQGRGAGAVVPLGNLERRPTPPPNLNGLLQDNYPATAKRQGIEGEARVKIRLLPSGRVRILRVVTETWNGFGQACVQTLQQAPNWSPAIGPEGQPVATELTFSCSFDVRY